MQTHPRWLLEAFLGSMFVKQGPRLGPARSRGSLACEAQDRWGSGSGAVGSGGGWGRPGPAGWVGAPAHSRELGRQREARAGGTLSRPATLTPAAQLPGSWDHLACGEVCPLPPGVSLLGLGLQGGTQALPLRGLRCQVSHPLDGWGPTRRGFFAAVYFSLPGSSPCFLLLQGLPGPRGGVRREGK